LSSTGPGFCWHPTRNLLAASTNGGLVFWDAEQQAIADRPVMTFDQRDGRPGDFAPIRFDASGQRLVVKTNDRLQLCDTVNGLRTDLMTIDSTRLPSDSHVAFAADGIAIACPNGDVRLFDLNGNSRVTLPAAAKATWVAFDSTGDTLYCGGLDYRCLIWDLQAVRSRLRDLGLDWD
jgi:WD40 repeat protein